MKKVKNIESTENDVSLEHIKGGKVKKVKQKNKKLKDAVSKADCLNLAPKNVDPHFKPINNSTDKNTKTIKKNKSDILKRNQEPAKEQNIVGNTESKSEKFKKKDKSKNNKVEQECDQADNSAKVFTDVELKKLEKKKAKKLAQKLKKKENKYLHETSVASTNGQQKTIGSGPSVSKNFQLKNSKLLTKKENKAQKRQLLKEEKLAEKRTRDPSMEAATIFVGNVPVNTKRIQLIRLFKDFAPINSIRFRSASGKVLLKHKQRKAAGSLNAYIVLKDKETAEKAISLNGVEFKGQHLRVTLATEISQSHVKDAKRTVFIGNLKYSATEESLREIFSSCGEIDHVRCIREGDKGCKGVAYICFKTADAVGLALELNGTIMSERPINVERYSIKKLGAKESREAQADKEQKSKQGVGQRLNNKKSSSEKDTRTKIDDEDKRAKKSDFRGVKIQGLKKKDKSKQKKYNSQMSQLAKKIAPKNKTT